MVSCGAFAAHTLKFKGGNGIWHLMMKRKQIIKTLRSDTEVGIWTPGLHRALVTLEGSIRWRLEICLSQMLSAVVTACDGALRELSYAGELGSRLSQMKHLGMVVHVESLLTAFSAEAGMLGDMAGVIHFANMYLEIWLLPVVHQGSMFEVTDISVSSNRLELQWKVPEALLRDVDEELPGRIRVHCVILNQGINEWQTVLKNGMGGDMALQIEVNETNFQLLKGYTKKFMQFSTDKQLVSLVADLSDQLELQVHNHLHRDIKMLEVVADLVSLLGGGHITVCKSGKDRTGMSVTHHQSRWVYNQTHASDAAPAEDMNTPGDISDIDVFDDLERGQGKVFTLSCLMRGFGTRLENTVKNTGMRGFAFNLIQRKCFPDLYRAPGERCAAAES